MDFDVMKSWEKLVVGDMSVLQTIRLRDKRISSSD